MEEDSVMNGWDEMALGEIKETFEFLAPIFDKSLKLQPNPRAMKQRRTEGKADQTDQDPPGREPQKEILQYLRVLGQLALRHERSLNLLQSTDSFILYFQQDKAGSLHFLDDGDLCGLGHGL